MEEVASSIVLSLVEHGHEIHVCICLASVFVELLLCVVVLVETL